MSIEAPLQDNAALLFIFCVSATGVELKVVSDKYEKILHPTVVVNPGRDGFQIDIYILPVCVRLWEKGIKTIFSCQGGPDGRVNGKIVSHRAYVVVKDKDVKKACKILKDLKPKIDKHPSNTKTTALRFEESKEAKEIPLIFEENIIKQKFK